MGLAAQLGNVQYARRRKFREELQEWLRVIKSMWPECPDRITSDGQSFTDRASGGSGRKETSELISQVLIAAILEMLAPVQKSP